MSLYWDVLESERLQGKLQGQLQERMNTAKIVSSKGVPDATTLCTGVTEEQLTWIKAAKLSFVSDSESSYSSPGEETALKPSKRQRS